VLTVCDKASECYAGYVDYPATQCREIDIWEQTNKTFEVA